MQIPCQQIRSIASSTNSMGIQPAVYSNRCAQWNQKFDESLKDKRINFIALTIISALGTLLLLQGFLSPARDIDGTEFCKFLIETSPLSRSPRVSQA